MRQEIKPSLQFGPSFYNADAVPGGLKLSAFTTVQGKHQDAYRQSRRPEGLTYDCLLLFFHVSVYPQTLTKGLTDDQPKYC
jgi:hypothetical protein